MNHYFITLNKDNFANVYKALYNKSNQCSAMDSEKNLFFSVYSFIYNRLLEFLYPKRFIIRHFVYYNEIQFIVIVMINNALQDILYNNLIVRIYIINFFK